MDPQKNPRAHGENMQTPNVQASRSGSNLRPPPYQAGEMSSRHRGKLLILRCPRHHPCIVILWSCHVSRVHWRPLLFSPLALPLLPSHASTHSAGWLHGSGDACASRRESRASVLCGVFISSQWITLHYPATKPMKSSCQVGRYAN